MTTNVIIKNPSNDENQSPNEHRHLLRPPASSTTFKPFPQSIIHSIENDRKRRLFLAHSTRNVADLNQSSIDENYETTTNSSREHIPSDIRIPIYPDILTTNRDQLSLVTHVKPRRNSDLSFIGMKGVKQNRVENFRRAFLEHRFGRRIHSSFSSTTTLRPLNRRRSTQTFPQRFYRRQPFYLSRNSKWHFVRNHLHDIAMMNDSYARMKRIEHDLRWRHLREEICKRVLDMREMSILRQQDDGKLKSSTKTSFDLKAIPSNEVVHVERDGRVYSIGTRDLVLGRLLSEEIQLDTFAQLEARRKVAVKQNLLRQQEGRNRLKKHIAFSFCLCNLSFIVLMFAAMFICAMKTFFELKSREYF